MARIRTIKPEFFTSSDITSLTPLSRLFYVALWCESDREGRLKWDKKTLKLRYFPAENCDINSMADELVDAGLVVIYTFDGKEYAEILMFKHHQVINNKEAQSILPSRVKGASKTRESGVLGEGKEGREGKGREHASTTRDIFDEFWQAYPKKKAKGDAEKAWATIKPNEHLAEQILQAVQRAKTSDQWAKDAGQFIPYPATWLRDKGWLDEATPALAIVSSGESWKQDPRFKGAR